MRRFKRYNEEEIQKAMEELEKPELLLANLIIEGQERREEEDEAEEEPIESADTSKSPTQPGAPSTPDQQATAENADDLDTIVVAQTPPRIATTSTLPSARAIDLPKPVPALACPKDAEAGGSH
jgi:hypothetical protein